MLRGLVVVAAACSPVMGGVLLNGSFEEPQQAGPGRYNIGLLSDWEATGGFMLLEQGVNGVSNIEAHTGTQFVSMGHSGATGDRLEQSFATEVGLRYDVSFATRSIQGLQPQEVLAEVTSFIQQMIDAAHRRGALGPRRATARSSARASRPSPTGSCTSGTPRASA
jgi:hypothetical protein